ncbi:magnesium/cobalt transporter CorA [Haladaptatus sp. DYSN1]|uniref:magnesium/cobalt transporter CorA n=1 Tax=unclassified Haladaptatus TaxID=2622732 RepID=UPI002404D03D|nr:magnesium/cobalt transporter CorA [Haladaptatus sp. DYSN1]
MTVEAIVFADSEITHHDDIEEAKAAHGTTWVRATEADEQEMLAVAAAFEIHPLTVEDLINDVRPKTEEFRKYTFVLVKTARLRKGETTFSEEIRDIPVGVYMGDDWVVTLSTGKIKAIDNTWEAVLREDERLLQQGPDFTAYRVIDGIVDGYFDVLDQLEDQIEAIEDEVTSSTNIDTLEAINAVRRDLLSFRKLAWPSREAIGLLARGDPTQIQQPTEKYYRDVYDHIVQVVDLIETYRDLATGARDIYLNVLSQSTNDVMKTLTVVATIVLPLTLVTGLYGMNITGSALNMPELAWPYAYPAVLFGMFLMTLILVVYFHERSFL